MAWGRDLKSEWESVESFLRAVSINIFPSSESATFISRTIMCNQPHFAGSGFQHPLTSAINGARSLLSWKVNSFEALPPRIRPSLPTANAFLHAQSKPVTLLRYGNFPVFCCQKLSAHVFCPPLVFPSMLWCALLPFVGLTFSCTSLF